MTKSSQSPTSLYMYVMSMFTSMSGSVSMLESMSMFVSLSVSPCWRHTDRNVREQRAVRVEGRREDRGP